MHALPFKSLGIIIIIIFKEINTFIQQVYWRHTHTHTHTMYASFYITSKMLVSVLVLVQLSVRLNCQKGFISALSSVIRIISNS